MDAIERKARALARERHNRICGTCKYWLDNKCDIVDDPNKCIYNDMELWQPNLNIFLELAEKVM